MVFGYKVFSVLWSIFGPNLRSNEIYEKFFFSEIWSFWLYGQFLPGPTVEHMSGTQCTLILIDLHSAVGVGGGGGGGGGGGDLLRGRGLDRDLARRCHDDILQQK